MLPVVAGAEPGAASGTLAFLLCLGKDRGCQKTRVHVGACMLPLSHAHDEPSTPAVTWQPASPLVYASLERASLIAGVLHF